MEIWLLQDKDKFQFPVRPANFENEVGNLNNTVTVGDIGEVNILGKRKLDTISISSFFPNQEYYFCDYMDFPPPYECVEIIKKFMDLGQVRLLITGTDINKIFYIENFRYGEQDGTGDVYFTIDFKEYRKLKIKTIAANSTVAPTNPKPPPVASPKKSTSTAKTTTKKSNTKAKEKSSKAKPKTHKVKKGETASSIAKKYYGSSSKYKTLLNKNNLKSAKQIKVGMVLKI